MNTYVEDALVTLVRMGFRPWPNESADGKHWLRLDDTVICIDPLGERREIAQALETAALKVEQDEAGFNFHRSLMQEPPLGLPIEQPTMPRQTRHRRRMGHGPDAYEPIEDE